MTIIDDSIRIIIMKLKLITVNVSRYLPPCPLYSFVNALKEIRLARDAINVPSPPILTARRSFGYNSTGVR